MRTNILPFRRADVLQPTPTQQDEDRAQCALESREGCAGVQEDRSPKPPLDVLEVLFWMAVAAIYVALIFGAIAWLQPQVLEPIDKPAPASAPIATLKGLT